MDGDFLIAWTEPLGDCFPGDEGSLAEPLKHYEIVSGEDAMQIRVSEITEAGCSDIVVGVITEGTN